MILYVNGCSHTAAAEAVNPYAFAEDDPSIQWQGRLPHPDNLAVSWGRVLADNAKYVFVCDAESAASNERICRTTKNFVEDHLDRSEDLLLIIQWSTWEREEWLHDGVYYQVNASGIDTVPQALQEKYRNYIIGVDWAEKENHWHNRIWELHQYLNDCKIAHVFFNGNNHFGPKVPRLDWGPNYIGPYDPKMTFSAWLENNGFTTVAPNSWHFGQGAHAAWARFVLQYCINNNMVG